MLTFVYLLFVFILILILKLNNLLYFSPLLSSSNYIPFAKYSVSLILQIQSLPTIYKIKSNILQNIQFVLVFIVMFENFKEIFYAFLLPLLKFFMHKLNLKKIIIGPRNKSGSLTKNLY